MCKHIMCIIMAYYLNALTCSGKFKHNILFKEIQCSVCSKILPSSSERAVTLRAV